MLVELWGEVGACHECVARLGSAIILRRATNVTRWSRRRERLEFRGTRAPPLVPMRFTIATYNIHKGFSHLNRRMVIHELREKLRTLNPDIVFLQEVQGVHERHVGRYHDWPGKPQHEFIADEVWHG